MEDFTPTLDDWAFQGPTSPLLVICTCDTDRKAPQSHLCLDVAILGHYMWSHLSRGSPSWMLSSWAHESHLSTVRLSRCKITRWSPIPIKGGLLDIIRYVELMIITPFIILSVRPLIFATCTHRSAFDVLRWYKASLKLTLAIRERNIVGSIIEGVGKP